MSPRKPLAFLTLFVLSLCAGVEARADTFVLQDVSGTMTFVNFPFGTDLSTLQVTAAGFSAQASNNEVVGGFNNSVGGNTILVGSGTSSFMGQSHGWFAWGATFDGFNVTGSVRWINLLGMGETIHTFTFTSAGVLTTEVLADGLIRHTVRFAGPAQAVPAPEPVTLLLLSTGLAGVGAASRGRRRAR